MLFNKKGSLVGAVLAVTIGILVIHVNFVIFQGLFDAIVRDISDYNTGDVIITDEFDFIEKSDQSIIRWFERIPDVKAATPRLSTTAEMNMTKNGNFDLNTNKKMSNCCKHLTHLNNFRNYKPNAKKLAYLLEVTKEGFFY